MEGQARERLLRERGIARLAEAQHGVVARRQLIDLGFKSGAIERRLESARLQPIHRGVYAVGRSNLNQRGRWMAAVLAYGDGAVLSHRSAAALWGFVRPRNPIDVTSPRGRVGRRGISLHECRLDEGDLAVVESIPVTNVARTLFDFSETIDRDGLARAWEEADRLGLLEMHAFEQVFDRGWGRHALKPSRPLLAEARHPEATRSPLEDRFLAFCRKHALPTPLTNVEILGHEVDAYWPAGRLAIESDSFEFHRHRAAFERDRARDTELMAAGYRVVRVTSRRLEREEIALAAQIRVLLAARA